MSSLFTKVSGIRASTRPLLWYVRIFIYVHDLYLFRLYLVQCLIEKWYILQFGFLLLHVSLFAMWLVVVV